MAMTSIAPLDRTAPSFKQDVDRLFAEQLPAFTEEAAVLEGKLGQAAETLVAVDLAATAAVTSAQTALASSASASSSKDAAAISEANTFSYLRAYRATSYGALQSNPAVDPNGDPPTVGDEYFNTSSSLMMRFNGATWQASDVATANLAAPSGSALVGFVQAGAGARARPAEDKLRETISARDYGVVGDGSDETARVQKAIDEAVRRGLGSIKLDTDCYCPGQIVNRSRVSFVGAGSLTGEGAYRRHVTREGDLASVPRFNSISPRRHLTRFSAVRSPKVVLVGSSTGSWQPNTLDAVSSLPHMLSARLAQHNPDKKVTFYNRAIGGQTFDTLNTVPTNFPAWYSDQAKPWLDYVKDLAPDAIFIIMGSNDAGAISQATLVSVVNKIKAFPKVPDIVFITQPSVCLDPDEAFASFGTKAGQEGRDYAAGLVRSFAQHEGYGLIDANRMGGIVLDGRDILDTASRRAQGTLTLPSGQYVATTPCHDFSMRLRFNGDAAAVIAAFPTTATSSNPVWVRIGSGVTSEWGGDIMFIIRNPAGKFRFELYSRGASLYKQIDSDIDFPTSSFSLDVAKIGNEVTVSVSGSEDSKRIVIPVKVHGGEFLPRAGHYGLSTGPFAMLEQYNVGEPQRYVPALTGVEAWGAPNPGATTSLPYGGNGVNHFSSIGTRAIYSRLLDEQTLAGAYVDSGRYVPALSGAVNLTSYTVDSDACMYTRIGNMVTVTGKVTLVPASNGLMTLDFSIPIPSFFDASNNLAGVATATTVGTMSGAFFGNGATDTARMQLVATSTASQSVRFSFTYEVL